MQRISCTLQFALAMFLILLSCFAMAPCLLILCTHEPSSSHFLASVWLLSIQLKIKCALWHDVGAAAWPGAKNNSLNIILVTLSPSVSYQNQIALIFFFLFWGENLTNISLIPFLFCSIALILIALL